VGRTEPRQPPRSGGKYVGTNGTHAAASRSSLPTTGTRRGSRARNTVVAAHDSSVARGAGTTIRIRAVNASSFEGQAGLLAQLPHGGGPGGLAGLDFAAGDGPAVPFAAFAEQQVPLAVFGRGDDRVGHRVLVPQPQPAAAGTPGRRRRD
jgi:hypothetical protein